MCVVRCGFLVVKPHTAPHTAARFITTCGTVWLLYFEGCFGWFRCGSVVW